MAETSSPSFDPRLARVVKIKAVIGGTSEATIGSGYLAAPGLVLTARHVLGRDGEPDARDYPVAALRIRPATGQSGGQSLPVSQALLLGEVSGVDVAVLVVPGLEPVVGTAVVGARFTTSQPVPGCWMIGYPKAAHQEGTVGPEYVGVSLQPVSSNTNGRIAVRINTSPVRKQADWRGLSGSGVVDAQNRLLGILAAVQVQWEGRLAVVPIDDIAKAIREHVERQPVLTPLSEVPVVEEQGSEPLLEHSKFPPRMTDLHGESLFDVLQFKHRVVDFISDADRGEIIEGTLEWVRTTAVRPDLKVAVMTGRAGVGKSRLAAEVCDRLAASDPWWRAGFADHDRLLVAPVPAVPTVVVIDYPERQPEAVGGFIASIHKARRTGLLQAPVRVVLVSRDERSWFERARTRCLNLDQLIHHRIALGELDFGDKTRALHTEAAYTAFCDGFGLAQAARPRFALKEAARLDRPLLIHAAALLAAWHLAKSDLQKPHAGVVGGMITNEGRLLDDLIGAEVERLRQVRPRGATTPGSVVFTSGDEVREALCVITLTAPARVHLPELLACTEAFGPNGRTNRIPAADTLLDCFRHDDAEDTDRSLQRIAPIEPDLIAAHLLATTSGRSDLIKRLVISDIVAEHPAYRAQLIGALVLASKDYPNIGIDLKTHLAGSLANLIDAGEAGQTSLAGLLTDHLAGLVEAAVTAAAEQELTAARQLATALPLSVPGSEHLIDHAAVEALWRLPHAHPALASLGVALAHRALAYAEREGDVSLIAAVFGVLGAWLGGNGQRSEALAATQHSVDVFEALAEGNRAAHLPNLAGTVNNLAVRLGESGRREEGLAAAQRAVDLCEELTASDRARHLPRLAASVDSLATRLAAVGWREEGLAAAQRAVDLCEELTASDRARHLPDLAASVNNLATRLAAVGRREEGLAAAQRAVDLREELARENRAAHLPDLAASVNNLAIRLGEAGQWEEGLAVAQRAVDLREELARENRAAHLPDLATSVNNLAIRLGEAGQWEEGLAAAQRAVELYEELTAENRAAYLPFFAASVSNLAVRLAAVGWRVEGLAAAQRAVDLREELTRKNRAAYLPDLAMSVNNLAVDLAESGRREEALAAVQHAVDLREELTGKNRAAYLPNLARSYWTAAHIRHVLEAEPAAGIEWCDKAIALYRELAAAEPEAFTPNFEAVKELRSSLTSMLNS